MTDEHLVIVMEYAANGQLFERIDTSGPITEGLARRLYRQLLDGMAYSHAQVNSPTDPAALILVVSGQLFPAYTQGQRLASPSTHCS